MLSINDIYRFIVALVVSILDFVVVIMLHTCSLITAVVVVGGAGSIAAVPCHMRYRYRTGTVAERY
jgi:hypothetical protein